MYTINEAAGICNISAYTIRFYDKKGLLPFIKRNKAGNREFSETDLKFIKMICLCKDTGLKIKEIKKYVDLWMEGHESLSVIKYMFIEHRKKVMRQLNDIKNTLNFIDSKIAYLNTPDASINIANIDSNYNKT